ncbi:MAG: ligand-binding sensor domain-containing protein [Sphingobacterium sp.]
MHHLIGTRTRNKRLWSAIPDLLYIVLFICGLSNNAQSNTPALYFQKYGVDQGLSNNAILCSVLDKDGFLWFGSKDGLNRFDGYEFKHYYASADSLTGLGSNFIHELHVDQKKNIWVGTDQGMYIFYPHLDSFRPFRGGQQGEVLDITADKQGQVWYIAENKLFSYNMQNDTIVQHSRRSDLTASALSLDENGTLWLGALGLIKNVTTGRVYPLDDATRGDQWIEDIYTDQQGILWVGTTKNGLYKFDPKSEKISNPLPRLPIGQFYIRDIIQSDSQTLWIASESGLIVYNKQNGSFQQLLHEDDHPWSLSDNAVYTVCSDQQGGIWIGTFFGGLNYYHPQHNVFRKFFHRYASSSISAHAVREFVEDRQGNMWIGSEDNGLSHWNKKTNKFTQVRNISHSNVHGLCLVGDTLLVGTFDQGMDCIDVNSGQRIAHFEIANAEYGLGSNFIVHILQTRAGRVFLATAHGLYEFIPGSNKFIPIRQVPDHIFYTSIFEDKKGKLWLSTWRDGLFTLDPKTGRSEVFTHQTNNSLSLNSNRVNRVFQTKNGDIWIATENGLARWSSDGKPIRRITTDDGLPSNLILTLQEDDSGKLWISTSRGLVCMNPNTLRMQTFTKSSGLLSLQFNYNSSFIDRQGNFYYGSAGGFIRFHPDSLSAFYPSKIRSNLLITGISVLQRELRVGAVGSKIAEAVPYLAKLKLPHDESTITLDFSAMNYVSAKEVQYKYMLGGYDLQWTTLRGSHTAHFTKIPPGNYTFRVQALNSVGEPISDERTLAIQISPPFWASIPAYICYWLSAGFLIYYLANSFDRKIKEKNRRQLEAATVERERELYQAKMNFFTQIAHDIKTPLTLIKAPLERLISRGEANERTERLLNTMHRNTEQLVELTNQLLDFRKIESSEHSLSLSTHDLSYFVTERLKDYQPAFEQRELLLSYTANEPLIARVDIEVVEKIFDNLMTNALKYAGRKVWVELSYEKQTQAFNIQVTNDGPQLTNESIGLIFKPFHREANAPGIKGVGLGLALAHSFAQLHGGTLKFLENSEKLNIFVLRIPTNGIYD